MCVSCIISHEKNCEIQITLDKSVERERDREREREREINESDL